MNSKKLFGLILACALVGVVAIQYVMAVKPAVQRQQKASIDQACLGMDPNPNEKLGKLPVPAIDIQALDYTGKMVPLSAYRGRVVLLNFFASWCAPCREEMPSMEELQQRLGVKDFVIVAVSSDDDWDAIKAFFANGTSMTVLWDPTSKPGQGGTLATVYGTEKIPDSYLIDRQGYVRYYFENVRDWRSPKAFQCIRALLDE